MGKVITAKGLYDTLVAIESSPDSSDLELLAVQLLEVAESVRNLKGIARGLTLADSFFNQAELKYRELYDQICLEAHYIESDIAELVPKRLTSLRFQGSS